MRAATKVIWVLKAQREQRVVLASRAPKVSRETPELPEQRVPLDTVARAVQVPKVIPVPKVRKGQKAPKGFKAVPVKLE